ncbi:MAG: MFS transporter [Candidatus Dormibacteria bacterium]
MSTDTTRPLTYRSLLDVRGLPRLVGAALLGRIAGQMGSVALVLFALQRFHSPAIAGVTVFASAFPGIAVSPLAGAILDRSGRIKLIMLDYSIAALAMALIVVLGATGVLSAGLLVGVAVLSSFTNPLSSAGTRTLFPMLVPPHLWDRANAIDSVGYVVAAVVGAPLAGVIAGLVGRPAALAATAAAYAAAALSLVGMPRLPLPHPRPSDHHVVRDAWEGLAYVARNPSLRGLAVSLSVSNLASGLLIVGLPVLVLDHLHQNAAVVGLLWALSAISGGVSALVAGQRGSQGRERRLILAGLLAVGVAVAALATVPGLAAVVAAMLVYGAGGGLIDIGMFSMRQRRTDPAWFGRAFAVSMSLNWMGSPIGSAIAGPLIGAGLGIALAAGAGFSFAAALFAALMIPVIAAVARPLEMAGEAPRPG